MPHCPLQEKRCGGCTRLSVPYDRQLRRKQQALEKLFDRVMPIEGMADPFRYRNKVIAAVARDRDGLERRLTDITHSAAQLVWIGEEYAAWPQEEHP